MKNRYFVWLAAAFILVVCSKTTLWAGCDKCSKTHSGPRDYCRAHSGHPPHDPRCPDASSGGSGGSWGGLQKAVENWSEEMKKDGEKRRAEKAAAAEQAEQARNEYLRRQQEWREQRQQREMEKQRQREAEEQQQREMEARQQRELEDSQQKELEERQRTEEQEGELEKRQRMEEQERLAQEAAKRRRQQPASGKLEPFPSAGSPGVKYTEDTQTAAAGGIDWDVRGIPSGATLPPPPQPPQAGETNAVKWRDDVVKRLKALQDTRIAINKVIEAMNDPNGPVAKQFNQKGQDALKGLKNDPKAMDDLHKKAEEAKAQAQDMAEQAKQAKANMGDQASDIDIDQLINESNAAVDKADRLIDKLDSAKTNGKQ